MDPVLAIEWDSMTQDEKAFFRALGARVAELRKESNITQVQLAATLGVSQQTVASWEVGRRGVPVSMLPALARSLGTSVEELIGSSTMRPAARRGPAPKLQQQLERLSALPKPKQRAVMEVLEAMLAQASR
jgi:transcriptional regulator with XRE-family HTH domain